MSNPIKYSDLFEDDGGLDKLIKLVNELEAKYKNISGTIITEVKKIKSETEKLTLTEENQTEKIAEKEKEIFLII